MDVVPAVLAIGTWLHQKVVCSRPRIGFYMYIPLRETVVTPETRVVRFQVSQHILLWTLALVSKSSCRRRYDSSLYHAALLSTGENPKLIRTWPKYMMSIKRYKTTQLIHPFGVLNSWDGIQILLPRPKLTFCQARSSNPQVCMIATHGCWGCWMHSGGCNVVPLPDLPITVCCRHVSSKESAIASTLRQGEGF
jgi:hypothetical protein